MKRYRKYNVGLWRVKLEDDDDKQINTAIKNDGIEHKVN